MLIGFVGHKGSGKDTAAQVLISEFGFRNVKFAGPLKTMLAAFLQHFYDEETTWDYIEGRLKESPCPALGGKTPRYAMQLLGTEWGRSLDQGLWVNAAVTMIDRYLKEGTPVVVTDVRYLNEAAAIKERGGYLIRVNNPRVVVDDEHSSERFINLISVDTVFENTSSIAHLHQLVRNFVTEKVSND